LVVVSSANELDSKGIVIAACIVNSGSEMERCASEVSLIGGVDERLDIWMRLCAGLG
jgi:hypothetical protein